MRLTPKILKKIERFALKRVKNNDILHQREHIESVVENCRILARKEKANFRVCKAAALLHDIEKDKHGKGDHAKMGRETARKFLKKINLDKDIVEQICYAIYKHNKNLPNKTIESRIVHDADRLDGLGLRGFLKHFLWATNIKKMNFNRGIKDAIREHEKFYKWLQTKTGKKIGKEKIKEVKEFLKYLK